MADFPDLVTAEWLLAEKRCNERVAIIFRRLFPAGTAMTREVLTTLKAEEVHPTDIMSRAESRDYFRRLTPAKNKAHRVTGPAYKDWENAQADARQRYNALIAPARAALRAAEAEAHQVMTNELEPSKVALEAKLKTAAEEYESDLIRTAADLLGLP